MNALASALRQAVLAQRFEATPDALLNGAPLRHFPSLDLAVVVFVPGRPAQAANVLFSREHPQGVVVTPSPDFGAVSGVAYQADVQGADGISVAWRTQADWSHMLFPALYGEGIRFVAPYPASLLKLMLAAGLAWWIEQGRAGIDTLWAFEQQTRPLRHWQHDMLAKSCNHATSALVAWGHAAGLLGPEPHALHGLFAHLDLPTLRFAGTQPSGGWRNAGGAGVGQLQMTAWDSLRLVWWLDADAPPCPWTPAPRLCGPGVQALRQALHAQELAGFIRHPRFAHKTGNTENYAADAGWLALPQGRRLLVALTSNLGARYAQGDPSGFPAKLVALGHAVEHLACTL